MANVSRIIGEEIILRRRAVLPDGRYVWESEDGCLEYMVIPLKDAPVVIDWTAVPPGADGPPVRSDPMDRDSWLT